MVCADGRAEESLPGLEAADKIFIAQIGLWFRAVRVMKLRFVTENGIAFLFCKVSDVDHEGRNYCARKHEVRHDIRTMARQVALNVVFGKSGEMRRFAR